MLAPRGLGHGIHLVLRMRGIYGFEATGRGREPWKGFSPLIGPLGSPDPLTHTYLGLYPMAGSAEIQIE
jgi:hypothetical protein